MGNTPNNEYRDLISTCPASQCDNKDTVKWAHASCGTQMKISQQADLYCSSCRTESFILDWRFACGKHENEFRVIDVIALVGALTVLKSQGHAHDRAWYDLMTKNFMRRYNLR